MRRLQFREIFLVGTIVGRMLETGSNSSAAGLPPGKQAVFLARVIAYDSNLKDRVGPVVNIAILALKTDKESERMSEDVYRAFRPLESSTLSGLPVQVSRAFFSGEDALEQVIRQGGIDTIYVCSGLDGSLAAIKRVAHKLSVLTIGSDEAQVNLGLSLGVFEMDGKNSIIVNLDASREEGVTFGPELLRLATVIR